jgi:murein DD-endopeptidase MepM/ murein hydrolase activator NlpD
VPVSRGTLKRKLSNVNKKIQNVEKKLRQTKIQEKNVTKQLVSTQQKLEKAQDKVSENKLNLSDAQTKLKVINTRLERTERQLKRRGKLLAGRLSDVYKGHDISYIDVLLGSRDMRTFLSRSYYIDRIVSSDVKLIKEIKEDKAQIESDKKAQAYEVKRIAAFQSQLVRQRDRVADYKQQKQAELDAIEHNRALYERAYADLMAESDRIAARLQAYQASQRSRGSYKAVFSGNLGLPVGGRITSRFGYRIHPVLHVRRLHTGVDIACPTGTPVHAAADGVVVLAGWYGAYGNAVVLDHGGNVSTLYGHNCRLCVSMGQRVTKGQVIAYSGSTGWSTGPHVHYEKRVNGRPVNPL